MRKAELQQLLAYTDYVWGEFRRVVSDSELSRVAEGSGWPTLRDCLSHMVQAHARWVPAIVDLRTGSMSELENDDCATWDQIEAARADVRNPLRERLDSWSEDELAASHNVDVDGAFVPYTRGELIAHLLLHERGHHGDVTTLFWQLGIEAEIALEYRFFLARHGTPNART